MQSRTESIRETLAPFIQERGNHDILQTTTAFDRLFNGQQHLTNPYQKRR